MLPVDIDAVALVDLNRLKENRVHESRQIEYKNEIPGPNYNVTSFLETVASFANEGPGDLILGVEAKDGVPVAISGCEVPNVDATALKIDQLIRDRLDPPYRQHRVRPIEVSAERWVFVIRIPLSYARPHRVDDKGAIMGRGTAGKHPMDMAQVREMILEAYAFEDRVKRFRADRLDALVKNHPPVPLARGPQLVVHVVPLQALVGSSLRGAPGMDLGVKYFRPMLWHSGLSFQHNLEGTVFFERAKEGSDAYTHVYRSGIIESVLVHTYREEAPRNLHPLSLSAIGDRLVKHLPQWLAGLAEMESAPPFYLMLSMTHLTGAYVPYDFNSGREASFPDRATVVVPELELQWPTKHLPGEIRPVLDILWQSFGYGGCPQYGADGSWQSK
jgi:hypothetical protein